MPSEAIKAAIAGRALALIKPPMITAVDDQMTLKPQAVVPGFDAVLQRGVDTLARCQSGQSALQAGVFSLSCTVATADEAGIRGAAAAALSSPLSLGKIDLLAAEAVASCQKEFADLLSASKIAFDVGSASISASSNGLLDALAKSVQSCPGTVRIEGHTDATGLLAANMQLSDARAAAVRAALVARGVADSRLLSAGFGPNQPIGDNATPAGRAKNRRIEFHIVTF
jgi:OmpA-OmpF porin, OOP family